MNVDNNMLYEDKADAYKEAGSILDIVAIPGQLTLAAHLKLAGQKRALVSRTSGGKLSKFAAEERKKNPGHKNGSQKKKR